MGERAGQGAHGATRWWPIEVSPMSDDQITAAQAESSPSLLRAKAAPLIKSAEWRHKANQILWSLMSPVIPGMVFIIHWFDHRMNLHKNKAWWIHYLMIPVVMITALILIIRWDETWSDGNTTARDGISQSEGSMAVTDQSVTRAWSPQFTSVWGPFTDNEPCPASLPWPALLSPDSNWFVYHDVDHCVPSLLEISGTSDTRRLIPDNYSRPIVILRWQHSRLKHQAPAFIYKDTALPLLFVKHLFGNDSFDKLSSSHSVKN